LEAGQAGSDIKCWWGLLIHVGGRSVRLWCRANDGLAGSAFKLKWEPFAEKKIWIYNCRLNRGTINVEMSHKIRIRMMHSFEWDMLESIPEYNADLWNLPARMSQWYPNSISIWYLSDCIAECHWTGWKVRCEIGKALCSGEAKQKGTAPATKQWWYDEKGYTMVQKYMNYDANDFSSIWTKVVLLTIKSEMNLLRSGYAVAIKNRVIHGKIIRIVERTSACNWLTSQLLACPILYL
jgi:hypothetical protein